MASLTAVTGNWSSTAASSTAFSSAATTAADEITIPNGVTVTIPSSNTVLCRSLTVANGGTLVFAATSSVVTIGDATAGTSNVALSVGSTATITLTAIGTINFVSTNTTTQTITTGGRTMPHLTFNGANGKWQLQDALTTTGNVTLTTGTLDTNSQDVTCANLVLTSATTKTLTLGSSAVSLTATTGVVFNMGASITGTTITANTATISASPGHNSFFEFRSLNMNGASLVLAASFASFGKYFSLSGGTFKDVSISSTATGAMILGISGDLTITGTLTITGHSTYRSLVQSSVLGTPRTITAAAVSLTDVDLSDITGAGAATWSGTRLGDALGNSGITFQTSRTLYAVAPGNFSSSSMWSLSSGGTAGEPRPLPQDDVKLNANSAAGNYSMDCASCRDLDCTGFTRSLTFLGVSAGVGNYVYGNVTLNGSGAFFPSQGGGVSFVGRGSHTFRSNGVTIAVGYVLGGLGGTYTLQDALVSTGRVTVDYGSLVTNNCNMTVGGLWSSTASTRTLSLGTSTITFTSTSGDVLNLAATNLTWGGENATFTFTAASAARGFLGAGQTFGALVYDVASSTGDLGITGANTFGTLTVGSGRAVMFPANTINKVDTLNVSGTTVKCATAGSSTTLNVTNPAQLNAADLQDVTINGDVTTSSNSTIGTNVKGVRRSPRYVGMMV